MPSLVIERGQEKGFSFALGSHADVVVGRDPANQVIISDPAASRRHFRISSRDGIWLIADLCSRNATYVNEKRLEHEQALAFGDRIQVGETVFSFLAEDQADKGKAGGLAGKDIAGYKILERVGRGGMGTVYKARQISLNRIVALKLLSSRYANDPSFVEKFVAEARAAAQLNHPNVVQVFDVGTVGGLHFFSMEFMEGGAVQDVLSQAENSRLHWTEALPMVMDAARGLVFAERHHIVHRDIKPDNLMLTVENKVKIGDLGLAAKSDEAGDGKIFGTPHFIAPEQARGKDVSHPADIYSLGASFYRMVAGRTPFNGETVKDILRTQINEPHTPLVQEIEDFPPDLSAILDKMMAKAVEDRYQSATELLEALEAFQIEHHIELAGGRKINKGLLATAAVVILGLIGVVTWQLSKDPEEKIIKEVKYRDRDPVKPTGPVRTAADIRRAKEMAATIALQGIQLRDPGDEVRLADKDRWLLQADAYDAHAAAAENADTPAATDAIARAKEIRETLRRLEREEAETVGAARTWWEREQAVIDGELAAGDWTAVLAAASDIADTAEAETNLQYVPDAARYLAGLEARVLQLARSSLDDELTAAQALLDGGRPSEALTRIDAWERGMREHAAAHEELARLADAGRDWINDRSEALESELTKLLTQDRFTYVDATRQVRTLPPGETSVFDYDFGACAAALEKRLPELQTWVYEDRMTQRVQQLRAADQAWATFVAALDAGEIVGPEEFLVGFEKMPPGARVTLSSSKPVTRTAVVLDVAAGPAKMGRTFRWADLLPSTIWEVFLRDRVDRLPGDLALGLTRVFVEVGHADGATHLLARAMSAGADLDAAARVTLEAEVAELAEYDELRTARDLNGEQRMAKVTAWRSRHVHTEMFLFLDGRPADRLPALLPQGIRDRFIETWGVRPE